MMRFTDQGAGMKISVDELSAGGDRNWHLALLHPSERCFLCGEALTGDLIFWRGADERASQIWLHSACAIGLAQKLKADARGARQKRGAA